MTTKTPDQLKAEIAYFQRILQSTTSRDRIQRARAGIAKRERLLATYPVAGSRTNEHCRWCEFEQSY